MCLTRADQAGAALAGRERAQARRRLRAVCPRFARTLYADVRLKTRDLNLNRRLARAIFGTPMGPRPRGAREADARPPFCRAPFSDSKIANRRARQRPLLNSKLAGFRVRAGSMD